MGKKLALIPYASNTGTRSNLEALRRGVAAFVRSLHGVHLGTWRWSNSSTSSEGDKAMLSKLLQFGFMGVCLAVVLASVYVSRDPLSSTVCTFAAFSFGLAAAHYDD